MNAVTSNRRLVVIILLAAAILLALIIATGGGFSSSPGTSPSTTNNAPAPAPPPVSSGIVQGMVTAHVTHLKGHTWKFVYTVKDTGKVPIAGFEINGGAANLFAITTQPGWSFYGSGVCGGKNGQILVYWSVGPGGTQNIPPGHSLRFGFKVNTTGTASDQYSLSYGQATPLFSHTTGPAASALPVTGSCH